MRIVSFFFRRGLYSLCAAAFALSACGSGPTDRSLADGLNQSFADKPVCFAVMDPNATPPMRVSASPNDPILAGLAKEGMITVQQDGGFLGFLGSVQIALTENGAKHKVWTQGRGFCLGHKAVDEIQKWTEPASQNGVIATRVSFTWKISGLPRWVKRDDFAAIPGMTNAQPGVAVMVKTNKGWDVQAIETDQGSIDLAKSLGGAAN
jgi:hypothetical protein